MTRRRARFLLALLPVLGFLAFARDPGAQTAAPVDTAAKPHRYSVKDSPGWYPAVDPESMSVVLGRRPNAPIVKMPFTGGVKSLNQVGVAVCRMLHHRAADSLLALCVNQDEFRVILWPEFPQSRPATGIQWDDAWRILSARLQGGSVSAVGEFGGEPLQFVRFERTDTTAVYKNFKLHNGLVLVAKDGTGQLQRYTWLRSVAERKGVYKIYSMKD
jgi:hypothetical protein